MGGYTGASDPMMGGGTPVLPAPPTPNITPIAGPPQASPAAQPQADPAAAANAAHSSFVGSAFKALSGQQTQYAVDPTTGQMQQTQTQNTPGQFFKNIVAGALIGGAIGADNAQKNGGSGLAAAMQGGRGVLDSDQQQNQQRIGQAQQEYANQLRAQQNQREQQKAAQDTQEAATKDTMMKAQTAGVNMQTLREGLEAQGKDFTNHVQVSDRDSSLAKGLYGSNNIDPKFSDIPESDIPKFLQDHKGAATDYHWLATGTKLETGDDGKPKWENTYSLYDNNASVPVTKAWLNTPEMVAYRKTNPEAFKVLDAKAGADTPGTVTPEQKLSLVSNAKAAYADQQAKGLVDLNASKERATISELNSESFYHSLQGKELKQKLDDENLPSDTVPSVYRGYNISVDPKTNKPILDAQGQEVHTPVTNAQFKVAVNYFKDSMDGADAAVKAAGDALKQNPEDKDLVDNFKTAVKGADEARGRFNTIINRNPQQGGSGGSSDTGVVQMLDLGGNPVPVPAGRVADAIKAGYRQAGGSPSLDKNQQVVVKLGNGTTQTMTRQELQSQQQKWANVDSSVNPQAAAFKNATVVGVAPVTTPDTSAHINPGNLH